MGFAKTDNPDIDELAFHPLLKLGLSHDPGHDEQSCMLPLKSAVRPSVSPYKVWIWKPPRFIKLPHSHSRTATTWVLETFPTNSISTLSAAQETLVTFHLVTTCDCKTIQDGVLIPSCGSWWNFSVDMSSSCLHLFISFMVGVFPVPHAMGYYYTCDTWRE